MTHNIDSRYTQRDYIHVNTKRVTVYIKWHRYGKVINSGDIDIKMV